MRLPLRLLVIGSCLALAACPGRDTARIIPIDPTIAHEDITRLRTDYVAAAEARDAHRLAQFFSPDAVLSLPNQQPVHGRDAIRDVLQRDLETFQPPQLTPEETRITADWAFDSGTVSQGWTADPPAGAPEHVRSTYAALLTLEIDGTWRIRRLVVSSDVLMPAGPAPSAGATDGTRPQHVDTSGRS